MILLVRTGGGSRSCASPRPPAAIPAIDARYPIRPRRRTRRDVLGGHDAQPEIVAGVEIDPDACETFGKAHPAAEVICDDVSRLPFETWAPRVDVVVGGPPCQPWSTGGKRLGEADPRDGWPIFLHALAAVRPRAFVAENVAGFAAGARKPHFDLLIQRLRNLGYHVTAGVLNAADYGVPQRRLRLLIVGTTRGRFGFPAPRYGAGAGEPWRVAGDVLGPDPVGIPNSSMITYARRPDPVGRHPGNSPRLPRSPHRGRRAAGRARPRRQADHR